MCYSLPVLSESIYRRIKCLPFGKAEQQWCRQCCSYFLGCSYAEVQPRQEGRNVLCSNSSNPGRQAAPCTTSHPGRLTYSLKVCWHLLDLNLGFSWFLASSLKDGIWSPKTKVLRASVSVNITGLNKTDLKMDAPNLIKCGSEIECGFYLSIHWNSPTSVK